MKKLPAKTQRMLATLEREAARVGASHHLRAARRLAATGKSATEIEGMTRWLFTKQAIAALLAEAKTKRKVTTTR